MMNNEHMIKQVSDSKDKYIRRCIKALQNQGLPIDEWKCTSVYDCKEDNKDAPLEMCELCGCDKVRFVHVMTYENIELHVGCICAGVMEGDIMKSKERERLMKNRASRKKNFMKKQWKRVCKGFYTMQYKNKRLNLKKTELGVVVSCDSKILMKYNGCFITNYVIASCAAFELVDPIKEALCEKK